MENTKKYVVEIRHGNQWQRVHKPHCYSLAKAGADRIAQRFPMHAVRIRLA